MSLSCTRERPAIVNSAVHSLSFGFAHVFLLTCASWSAGTPRLRHVRTDRPVYMSGGAFLLENLTLVLPARLASPSRLPFSTVLRESRFFCLHFCLHFGFVRPALEVRTETDLHLLGLLILLDHWNLSPHSPGNLGNLTCT